MDNENGCEVTITSTDKITSKENNIQSDCITKPVVERHIRLSTSIDTKIAAMEEDKKSPTLHSGQNPTEHGPDDGSAAIVPSTSEANTGSELEKPFEKSQTSMAERGEDEMAYNVHKQLEPPAHETGAVQQEVEGAAHNGVGAEGCEIDESVEANVELGMEQADLSNRYDENSAKECEQSVTQNADGSHFEAAGKSSIKSEAYFTEVEEKVSDEISHVKAREIIEDRTETGSSITVHRTEQSVLSSTTENQHKNDRCISNNVSAKDENIDSEDSCSNAETSSLTKLTHATKSSQENNESVNTNFVNMSGASEAEETSTIAVIPADTKIASNETIESEPTIITKSLSDPECKRSSPVLRYAALGNDVDPVVSNNSGNRSNANIEIERAGQKMSLQSMDERSRSTSPLEDEGVRKNNCPLPEGSSSCIKDVNILNREREIKMKNLPDTLMNGGSSAALTGTSKHDFSDDGLAESESLARTVHNQKFSEEDVENNKLNITEPATQSTSHQEMECLVEKQKMAERLIAGGNTLKRRASDTPLEEEDEQRRRRMSSGEIQSKQIKLDQGFGSSNSARDDSLSEPVENASPRCKDANTRDLSYCEPHGPAISAAIVTDSVHMIKNEKSQESEPCFANEKRDEENNLNNSIDFDKSSLSVESLAEQDMMRPMTPRVPKELEEPQENCEDKTLDVAEDDRDNRLEEADDNSSSSNSSSSSDSTSSSSSSSSSSSESDSSGDEAEAGEEEILPVNQSVAVPEQPLETATAEVNVMAAPEPIPVQMAPSDHDSSEESSRDSTAMEVDESAESDEERPGNREDEAKITRSEGLKLSISLKRSSTVVTPSRSEETPKTVSIASSVPPPLQPVDFSNILKKGLLLNESKELIKIDYNQVPVMNYSQQVASPGEPAKIRPLLENVPVQQLQYPTAWNIDGGMSAGNILKNTLMSKHLSSIGHGGNSVSLLNTPTQDESSDTMDEDNRLVIAEKQRRYRKKNSNNQPPVNAMNQMNPNFYPFQQGQPYYPHVPDTVQNNVLVSKISSNTSLPTSGVFGDQMQQLHNQTFPPYSTFPDVEADRLLQPIISPTIHQHTKAKTTKASNNKRTVERKKRNQSKPVAGTVSTVGDNSLTDAASLPYPMVSKHLTKSGKTNEPVYQHQQSHQSTISFSTNPSGFRSKINTNMLPESIANSQQVPAVPLPEKKKDKKKVFLCSPCGTHYENWNLFLHMREVHRKHICLYCLGIFQSAERLVNHLGTKHGVLKKHHGSIEEYLQQRYHDEERKGPFNGSVHSQAYGSNYKIEHQPFYLMCSRCEHMFESTTNSLLEIRGHDCGNYLETCSNCGQLKQSKHRCDGTNGTVTSGKKKTLKKTTLGISAPESHCNGPFAFDGSSTKANGNVLGGGGIVTSEATPSKGSLTKGTGKSSSRKKQPSSAQHIALPQEKNQQQLMGSCILETQLLRDVKGVLEQASSDMTGHVAGLHPELSNFDPAQNQRTTPSYAHLQSRPLLNGSVSHQTECMAPVNTSTPLSNEPVTTVSTLLPPVDQQVSEPPTPVVTPLVPKLKVKIPIQYLTPMESEESSAESDEEEEEDEEENEEAEDNETYEEEEEANEEIKEAKEENEINDTVEKEIAASSAINHSETSAQHLVEHEQPFVESKSDNQHELNQASKSLENLAEVAEDTVLQEPVPMDIDESLMIERRRDVPTRTSLDLNPSLEVVPSLEEPSTVGTDRNAPAEQLSNSLDAVKGDLEKLEPVNILTNSLKNETNASAVFDDDGKTEKTTAMNESTEQSMTGEVRSDLASTIDEFGTSGSTHPTDACAAKDQMVIADSDAQLFTLSLDEPLDRISIREFLRICLRETVPFCLYCNHARRIAVNGRQLVLHIIAMHRFQATVNSITGEELLPETILQRFLNSLDELEADRAYLNVETFDNSWTVEQRTAVPFVKVFECFQCRFVTVVHKELYLHNRKMHQKSVLLCLMCKGNFFSYSELLCHMCPGVANHTTALDYVFRCCVCNVDGIPSAFRLMVHLRKRHYTCDVCLEECLDQSRLSNHVWKHKLHHLCYRCGIGYRNKADILKHLFWKHGTEGVLCKRCLQKKWPHVYHFCVPPAQFVCEVCQATFNRSVALKVHRRLHNGDAKYPCTEDGCEKRFISKKLLLKHVERHYVEKTEMEKEQINVNMVENPLPNDDEEANDVKLSSNEDAELAGELKESSNIDAVKTEPQLNHMEENVAMSLENPSSEGKCNDDGGGELNDRSTAHLAEKGTIKREETEESNNTLLQDRKHNNDEENNKEQVSDTLAGKETATDYVTTADGAATTTDTKDLSTPLKKSKKKRKAKDDDKSVVDLMNLPALNLSESDSSDDSDNENSNASLSSRRFMDVTEAEGGDQPDDLMESVQLSKTESANAMDVEENVNDHDKPEDSIPLRLENEANVDDVTEQQENASQELTVSLDPIANIWNNFKRYQANHRTASRKQSADEEQRLEDEMVERMLKSTILHVSQSDHDYCMMFKPFTSEAELEAELQTKPPQESLLLKGNRIFEESTDEARPTPEMKNRGSNKRKDQSSDSEDSSDSDSSCECGSNCSCSSSSSNSSSSSSDDSDSSDNEDARKGKKKTPISDHSKKDEDVSGLTSAEVQTEQEEVEELPPPEPVDPDSVIVDSDLYTDESETDEEFYDEHPQKLANQLLAEKRRQLLAQTGASNAMMNYGMVENSRPSTPSLPPEEMVQGKKKIKPKKRKRDRKSSKRLMSPASAVVEQSVPVTTTVATPTMDVASYIPQHVAYHWPAGEQQISNYAQNAFIDANSSNIALPAVPHLHQQPLIPPVMAPLETPPMLSSTAVQSVQPTQAANDMGKISAPRLSTGNSSESDAPLKRSQRSRKPNKFYGYTSDDESAGTSLPLPSGITLSTNPEKSILSLMKPTPPPNLVWSKEDLPSPPTKSSKTTGSGAGGSSKVSSAQRRSVDHLTPVSSRRNSGTGMSQDELSVMPPTIALIEQQPIIYPLQIPTTMVSTLLPGSDVTTPTAQNHPPLPKLKLSLGKKASVATVTPKGVKQASTSRRRKPTPKTPKVKTPKSAPPVVPNLQTSMTLPMTSVGSGPLSAPLVPSAGALYQVPSVAESRPKIPPIGSFPSIQTNLFRPNQIRVPAGWRAPKEGESVYCYCRAPYDEVSEMIACDDDNCRIEWFHFECVGIIMPPKGKWYCPDCKLKQVQSGVVMPSDVEGEQEASKSSTLFPAGGGDQGMSSLAVATSTNGSSLAQPSSAYSHWGQQP
uniref:C2H2-type domain-containing protein n=1 Tax=Anopheles funestus TaxID=62324 RepID=A0A182RRY7_ANOFN